MPVKILVVDDEPDLELLVRQKFRKQIRGGEYEIAFTCDDVEALRQIAVDPRIELVFLTKPIDCNDLEGLVYETLSATLAPGDAILLYTDGVTEAMDAGAALFGESRLEAYLASVDPAEPQPIVLGVVEAVWQVAGETAQSDDLTALAISFRGR